jgi:hypothetical protein
MPTPAGPGTNQFRCDACGRYFNTADELRVHEPECRLAKETTAAGRKTLEREELRPHDPNDVDKDQIPFQHGTKPA